MAEFDRFSGDYAQILDQSTAMFGEGADYFAEHKAKYIEGLISPDYQGKILDFGCGVGLLARFMLDCLPNATLHGFDVSPASIDAMDPRLRARGEFTTCISDLSADYDVIVVSNVMHHIRPNERQATVCALGARLRVGGLLLIFEHNPLNPLTRWVVAHCPFDDDAVLLPRREATSYINKAGLQLARVDYVLFFPQQLRWLRRLEIGLTWCPLGAQYVVVGEKRIAV